MCESNQISAANADLTINGKKIELNTFVESFISQTLIGNGQILLKKDVKGTKKRLVIKYKFKKLFI